MQAALSSSHAASVMPAMPQPDLLPVPLWRPADNQGHYWPCELLQAFTLLMAARGKCVSTDMMLGRADYALEKLGEAHSSGDEALRELAIQLFEFFDAARLPGVGH